MKSTKTYQTKFDKCIITIHVKVFTYKYTNTHPIKW